MPIDDAAWVIEDMPERRFRRLMEQIDSKKASRIVDLKKAFNIREGWTPADDTLPRRLLEQPIPEGSAAGERFVNEVIPALR